MRINVSFHIMLIDAPFSIIALMMMMNHCRDYIADYLQW
jgi:hypothetical protein